MYVPIIPDAVHYYISRQLLLSQANWDASIAGLIVRIKRIYELLLEHKSPSKLNAMKNVLVEIAQAIRECAQFIAKYSEIITFCRSSPLVLLPSRSLSLR